MAEGSGVSKFSSRPIFYRWWFWVALVVAFAVVWYLQGYIGYFGDQAKYRLQNSISNDYIAGQEAQQAALEKQYKNDPYGGATPEETLKLFIEALEKKDYVLASNLYVPESRSENLKKIPEGVKSGGLAALIKAYQNGQVKFTKFDGENKYEADVIPVGETVGFYFRFISNPFNSKWLISEQ
jgi:hypothetical protein